jgi:hypothetical protein
MDQIKKWVKGRDLARVIESAAKKSGGAAS